jgi:hypothetical protein
MPSTCDQAKDHGFWVSKREITIGFIRWQHFPDVYFLRKRATSRNLSVPLLPKEAITNTTLQGAGLRTLRSDDRIEGNDIWYF